MTRVARTLAWGTGALAAACACAALLARWLAPDNVLALWSIAAFCR